MDFHGLPEGGQNFCSGGRTPFSRAPPLQPCEETGRTCTAVDANASAVAVVRDAARVDDDVVANVLQKQSVLQVARHDRTVHVEFRLRFCQIHSERSLVKITPDITHYIRRRCAP